jgi:hypothetical protein
MVVLSLRQKEDARMTPVEIRNSFAAKTTAYRDASCVLATRIECAKAVVTMLDAHPWLIDQIAWDVHDMARRDAKR